MKKSLLVFLYSLLLLQLSLIQQLYAQAPHIEWQRCYGGSKNEHIMDFIPTKDGNYVALGSTNSVDGDVGSHLAPEGNAWALKIDKKSDIIWSKTLFTDGNQGIANSGIETDNGDFLITAYKYSDQAWGIKLDNMGNKIWHRYYTLLSLQIIKDFVPNTFIGINGIFNTEHNYSYDLGLVKFDTSGTNIYLKKYGGNSRDNGHSITKTSDNCYILVGETFSNNNGDVGPNNTNEHTADIWVLKVNTSGNIIWQKCLGKRNLWETGYSVVSDDEGGCVLTGLYYPDLSDGIHDVGIYHLDSNGNLVWQKNYGGSRSDWPTCIAKDIDGGYVISAVTTSNDRDVSGNHGGEYDGWVLKVDRNGNLVWQMCLGGSEADELKRIYVTPGGDYMVAGYTRSNDGDVSGYHGNINQEWGDYWVVRLSHSYCSGSEYITSTLDNKQIFKTNSTIEALNTITNTGDVMYNAKTSITLNPGFKVEQNGQFTAVIDGCQN